MRVDVPDLLARLGVEVVRPDGRELWALCPLHPDTDASFQIRSDPGNERNGWWRCFGCHDGGGPARLVEEVLGLDRREAAEWIADSRVLPPARFRVGLDVVDRGSPIALPAGVVVAPVTEWVAPARRYVESRGITPVQVDRWGLGYATRGRMRFRVVVPIRDARGRLVSYTGRTFTHDAKRYLEPSREERPVAGAVFGEECWPVTDRGSGTVVVVEGVFDALAAERVRPDLSVAAACGSDFHPSHASKLATFGRVAVVSDPDRAGDAYAEELGAALRRYCEVVRVRPAEGRDLADLSPRERFDLLRDV